MTCYYNDQQLLDIPLTKGDVAGSPVASRKCKEAPWGDGGGGRHGDEAAAAPKQARSSTPSHLGRPSRGAPPVRAAADQPPGGGRGGRAAERVRGRMGIPWGGPGDGFMGEEGFGKGQDQRAQLHMLGGSGLRNPASECDPTLDPTLAGMGSMSAFSDAPHVFPEVPGDATLLPLLLGPDFNFGWN